MAIGRDFPWCASRDRADRPLFFSVIDQLFSTRRVQMPSNLVAREGQIKFQVEGVALPRVILLAYGTTHEPRMRARIRGYDDHDYRAATSCS